MPRIACEITVLPEPLSPTSATVRSCWTSKLTPRTACDHALVGEEVDRQVADLQQRAVIGAPEQLARAAHSRAPRMIAAEHAEQPIEEQPAGLVHGQMMAEDADRLVGVGHRDQPGERCGLADEQARAAPVDGSRWVLTWRQTRGRLGRGAPAEGRTGR